MRIRLGALAAALLLALPASAQAEYAVAGRVVDAETGAPIQVARFTHSADDSSA